MQIELDIGQVLSDLHGKSLSTPPPIDGIVWTDWIHIRDVALTVPYIGGMYTNKLLVIIGVGAAMATYDGMHTVIGTFELEDSP